MKFIPVEELPTRHRQPPSIYKQLNLFLLEFMRSNTRIARIEYGPGDYKHNRACGAALRASISRFGFPIAVREVNCDIYLIRRDMGGNV